MKTYTHTCGISLYLCVCIPHIIWVSCSIEEITSSRVAVAVKRNYAADCRKCGVFSLEDENAKSKKVQEENKSIGHSHTHDDQYPAWVCGYKKSAGVAWRKKSDKKVHRKQKKETGGMGHREKGLHVARDCFASLSSYSSLSFFALRRVIDDGLTVSPIIMR